MTTIAGTPLPTGKPIMHSDFVAAPNIMWPTPPPPPVRDLPRQQLRVLQRLAAGLSNAAIAAQLGVTVETVETHTARLYTALGVTGVDQPRPAAVACGFRRGLLR